MKKFYFLLVSSLCFLCSSFAQTIINPVTGGGFDAGNTFAANGWVVVNSSVNKWVVGATTYDSPPYSAYISSDGNPANWSYNNANAHISHFYQQVDVPANAINVFLTYSLKGNFQNDINGDLADGLQVYTDESLTPPVADALPGGAAVLQIFQFNNNISYLPQTINLNSLAGKSALIIFTWINNGDGIGDDPPASVDALSLTYCIKPSNDNVTGGGAFCEGSGGASVGLSNSTTGISYQLYKNLAPEGAPINGTTGSPLDFGLQTEGTYTVVGTSACGYNYTMAGSVTVTKNPVPTAVAGSNSPLCSSAINLTSSGGVSYSWTGPDGFTSTDQNPSLMNVTAAASGTYTVTVTGSNGCSATANTDVTVSVGGTLAGGSVASTSICSGGNGTLTLTGNSDTPASWEYSTDSTSATWTPISNTGLTQGFSGITVPTFYRAVISNMCGSAKSSIATVAIHNYWTGADITYPTDWNTPANWSDNMVPSTACDDVYIPNTPNKPVLSNTPVATIKNLHIFSGAKVTITGPGLMQIGGDISNSGVFDVTDGTVEFNRTSAAQNIAGSTFYKNTVKNIIVSNNTGVNVANTLTDTLNVTGTLSFGSAAAKLNTGNNITLKSSATATANVGKLVAGNTITGDVAVERYIATGNTGAPNHGKSWQLLAIPTTGQTIKEAWQEGATASNVNLPAGSNPHPGYGTMLTSDVPGATTQTDPGFDAATSSPSIKVYDYLTNDFTGPASTKLPIYNKKGYYVFVRGDRSVFTSAAPATPTILRTTGKLFTPANPPPKDTVKAGKFESIGNPYASALDLRQITKSGGANEFFYVWDPRLGGNYGYGGYQTLSFNGTDYEATPGKGSYSDPVSSYVGTIDNANYIQSGQAFLVQATGSDGYVNFTEAAKDNGSALFTTPNPVPRLWELFKTSLYNVNADGSTTLLDGVLNNFGESYSNAVDGMDARKAINTGENLSIKIRGALLSVERRHTITQNDTIFLNLTGVRVQQYRFVFNAENMSPLIEGFLEDNYLHTRTPLNINGTTVVNFNMVNIPGAYAANRFRIVFAPLKALPVTFTSIKAYRQGKDINVEWKVENEMNVKQYEVEKSIDGTDFTTMSIQAATANDGGSVVYVAADVKPVEGYNYYRVKSVDINGKSQYTNVVKVLMGTIKQDINIFPNPITDGMIHLQLTNQPGGKYGIRLHNKLGQLIISRQVNHSEGSSTELIKWDYNLAHGLYNLEVSRPDGTVKRINVMY